MIEVRFEKKTGLSAAWVKNILAKTLLAEKRRAHLDVLVTGDRQIRKINKKFLKHDYATDVISFLLGEGEWDGRSVIKGDLVVSVDTAKTFSRELGLPLREELARYLIHGTLHLLGYDDKKPADFKKMHSRQEQILRNIL